MKANAGAFIPRLKAGAFPRLLRNVQDVSLLNNDDFYASSGHIMGSPKLEPRSRFVGLRFTEKEYVQLQGQMANADYLSLSKYIRDKALDRQIDIRKNIVLTDRNLRNQINNLSSTVARIGVDYNQATKKFNTLAKLKRSDGSPVISVRAANYYLISLQQMTRAIKEAMDRLIRIVSRLDYDNVPHGGEQL